MERSTPASAVVRPQGTGPLIWTRGALMELKATHADTHGAYGLVDELLPPGFAPPLHIHHGEDEAFYVLDGQVRFACGAQTHEATAGAFIFLPRGVAHTFRVLGDSPARVLNLLSPAGFERFFEQDGVAAPEYALPPDSGPVNLEHLRALAAHYECAIIGPPLAP
jgi:quercetin dioxygenase-like cupin family protein